MERKSRKQTREDILEAVIACGFEEENTSVQSTEIAAKAGVSTRTLNRYFPDKDQMFFEAAVIYLEQKNAKIVQRYEDLDLSHCNGRESLLRFIESHLFYCRNHLKETVTFVYANITCVSLGVRKKSRKPGFGGSIKKIMIENIERGIADGSVRHDLDVQKTCLLIAANFNGLMQRLVFVLQTAENNTSGLEIFSLMEEYLYMLDLYLRPQKE